MSQELINNFHNKLNEVVQWRFQELLNINSELDSLLMYDGNTSHKSFVLRGAIALIYAHWEGAVKDIFLEYNKFLNSLLNENTIPLNKHSIFILELLLHPNRENESMRMIFCNIFNLNKLLHNETITLEVYKENIFKNINESKTLNNKNIDKLKPIEKFLNLDTQTIKIVDNVINTKSNLGFEELKNILNKFDIIITTDVEIQRHQINQLLNYRNNIAHGHNTFFNLQGRDIQKIQHISEKIINLIELIREKLRDKSSLILNFS